ncbi:LysM repeat protein [Pontibacter ummariensis]|uniref:LysM repeat-containing protein n=1 Tax=Pontibacter ummariensis TaxID=1610492 RepID=A0A239KR23_9BACT|nr:LysM peptidoglycan-binding domain-containing protein [Pontibacter ummariensis]PRY05379.1 LysM repeat protein [Pontibacter ummariensis]SNT20172.1 LysM repeat-containing protein [Pontibacter ummariensis]
MVRSLFLTLVAVPALSLSASAFDLPVVRDSVGIARKNGKLFVQHKVEPKETLYALSRKYSVPVAQIVEANPSVETTIKIGEIVLIPRKYTESTAVASASKAAAVPAASNRTYMVNDGGHKMHTVEPKQTLYSISRLYGVKVEDIRRWNQLPDNNISIGSSLIVGMSSEKPTKKPMYVPEPDDEMTKAVAVENALPAETASTSTEPVTSAEEETKTVEDAAGVKKVIETGLAEMIDPKADTNKYLALHRTAPVGTIMQIKNDMNQQVVYVRVVGKLPETGANDKVIVRLSKKAYQKLGAVDQKFRVELSYMP